MFVNCTKQIESIDIRIESDVTIKRVLIAINCNKFEYFDEFIEEFVASIYKEFIQMLHDTPTLSDFIDRLYVYFTYIGGEMRQYNKILNIIKEACKRPLEKYELATIYNDTSDIIKSHMTLKLFDFTNDILVIWEKSKSIAGFRDTIQDTIITYVYAIKKTECKIIRREVKSVSMMVNNTNFISSDYDKLLDIKNIINNLYNRIEVDYTKKYIDKKFRDDVQSEIKTVEKIIIKRLRKLKKSEKKNNDDITQNARWLTYKAKIEGDVIELLRYLKI